MLIDKIIPLKVRDDSRFIVMSRPAAGWYKVEFHISSRNSTLVGYSVFDNYTEAIHAQVNWLAIGILPEICRNGFNGKVELMIPAE